MTAMHDNELRLDGNAVAGMLSELFATEATMVMLTCASCGRTGALGAAHAYARGPGAVLRCPGCTSVLLRATEIRGRLMADMRGVSRVEL
jgi:ribosomal protein S27E